MWRRGDETDETDDATAGQPQFRTGKWTFVHDRRVVETFHEEVAGSTRFHVDHLRIDGRPAGSDLRITWGIEINGRIIHGGGASIPADRTNEFNEFVRKVVACRTAADI